MLTRDELQRYDRLMVKVSGRKEDDVKITEKIHLDGKEARGLAKSRLVLNDNAKAVVRGETYGNAPFARGHGRQHCCLALGGIRHTSQWIS